MMALSCSLITSLSLFVQIALGMTLEKFSEMSVGKEGEQRKYMRLDSGLDKISPHEAFSNEEFNHAAGEYRIHMVGDSTTRNQFLAMCSQLVSPKNLPTELINLRPSPKCVGDGWGYKRLIVTGTFDRINPIPASLMPEILTTAQKAYKIKQFDAVYFGSTAIHLLRSFPALEPSNFTWAKTINFEENVSDMIRVVKMFTPCPIFHTMHYVCDSLFYGKRADALKELNDQSQLQSVCQKWTEPRSIEACMTFLMSTKGSMYVARAERRGIELLNSSVAVVDTFTLTYKQCWASNDGVHYIKLLPLHIQLLSERVYACQEHTSRVENGSIENVDTEDAVSIDSIDDADRAFLETLKSKKMEKKRPGRVKNGPKTRKGGKRAILKRRM